MPNIRKGLKLEIKVQASSPLINAHGRFACAQTPE